MNLTDYSLAGGCGCKVSHTILRNLLDSLDTNFQKSVISAYQNFEDAAVYKIDEQKNLVCSVDFFTPIVNDAYSFGRISACNSISDLFVKGVQPILALSVLGFPKEIENTNIPLEILKGAEKLSQELGFSIVGGHTIYNPQIIFGLSVIGMSTEKSQQGKPQLNDYVYLTKPLGTGILSTALKEGRLTEQHKIELVKTLETPNSIGLKIKGLGYANIITDITGFGLVGHLSNFCTSMNMSVKLNFENIIKLQGMEKYIADGVVTRGGKNNWEAFRQIVKIDNAVQQIVLCDPQTNGGLLISVAEKEKEKFESFLKSNGLLEFSKPIGLICTKEEKQIVVR